MQKCFLTLALMAGVLQASAQNNLPDSIVEKLNKAIADFQTKQHCPGMAVAVVKENDIIYNHTLGYTDLDNKTPVTIDTRFPIMSVTKTFTATMLVQLAERGVVSMHDKVTKYIPEYKVHWPLMHQGFRVIHRLIFIFRNHWTAGFSRMGRNPSNGFRPIRNC
jgi:CubicO group peptidase (beta-lactamase class C family)